MVRTNVCDTYPYIMLLCLIVRAVANKAADYIREQDMFVNHGSRNFTTASDFQCCVACMLDDCCESVSYNDANKVCQANDRNPYIDGNAAKTSSSDWTSFYKKPKCRSGWTSYSGSCYHVVTTRQHWTSAENNCQALGGHLVDFQDAEEEEFVQGLAQVLADRFSGYWIGFNDVDEEGTFVWSSSAPFHFQRTIYRNNDERDFGRKDIGEEAWDAYKLSYFPSICKADN